MAWLTDMMGRLGAMIRRLFGRGAAASLPRRQRGGKKTSAVETLRLAALKDPEAARFYLRQRVLVGDGPGAAEFYREVVMPRYPDLVLDPDNQAALVRVLEFSGFRLPGVRAAELFLARYPAEPGWDVVALSLGRLLLENGPAASLPEAIRHLGRAEAGAPEKRHRAEARRLRDALVVRAEAEGIDLVLAGNPADPQPVETRAETGTGAGPAAGREMDRDGTPQGASGLQMRVVSGPKKRSLQGGDSPLVAPAGRRPPEEPHRAKKAQEQATPVLEGRQPLPLKSAPAVATRLKSGAGNPSAGDPLEDSADLTGGALLGLRRASRRTAGLMPFAPGGQSAAGQGDTVYGAAPPPEVPSAQAADPAAVPPVGEGAYGVGEPVGTRTATGAARAPENAMVPETAGTTEPPRTHTETPAGGEGRPEPSPDEPKRKALPPAGEESRKTTSSLPFALEAEKYSAPPLAGGGTARVLRSAEPGSRPRAGNSARGGVLYAVLVPDLEAARRPVVESIAEAHLREGESGRQVRGVPGLVVRQAPLESARAVAGALAAQGIAARVVADDHPLLHAASAEALSLQIEGDQVTAATERNRITLAASGVLLLRFSRMRLSARSQSSQRVLEVIATPPESTEPVRVSLWERTCRTAACRVDGAPVPGDDPLGALHAALRERVPAEALLPAAAGSPQAGAPEEEGAAVYQSFRDYDDALAAEVLSRWAREEAELVDGVD